MLRLKRIKYGSSPRLYETGVYKGYRYYIVDNSFCPCAYVALSKKLGRNKNPLLKEGADLFLPVHGGVTYCKDTFNFCDLEEGKFLIGWDYGHAGDFIKFSYIRNMRGHKYKYKEIISDIKDFILYYIAFEREMKDEINRRNSRNKKSNVKKSKN